MSRQEVTNTFTKGMVMDLNPINTPNEVLTDCVNGTLITYDGNEYSLQNEKGNYLLKNCKLPSHYIPVGLKEYGDILYIVSYNPLDKHVEIGSYPSPKTINETGNGSLSPISVNDSFCGKYSEIADRYEKLSVFYGAIPDDYKLNPGDEYKVTLSGWGNNIYSALELYAIDDDRKPYLLGSYRPYNGQDFLEGEDAYIKVNNDFKYIGWDVPGWIGIKPRCAYIDDFKVNVKKIVFSNYTDSGYLALNFQLTTSDKIFTNLKNPSQDLYAKLTIDITGTKPLKIEETVHLNTRVDLKNGSHIYYSNWPLNEEYKKFEATEGAIITITVTPYLDNGCQIIYDEYEKILTFDVSKKGNVNDFTIGNESWRYGTYNDERKFTLTFETAGLEATSVLNQDVFLFYDIYSLSRGLILKDQQCTNWVMLGETSMEIDLAEYVENSKDFVAEDIYVFEFKFYSSDTPAGDYFLERDEDNRLFKLVVASELMNKFVDEGISNFEDITFDQWISGYEDSVKNKSIKIADFKSESSTLTPLNPEDEFNYKLWIAENGTEMLPNFIDETSYKNNLKNGFHISNGGTFTGNVKYKTDLQLLYGPLWDGLLNNSNLNIDLGNKDVLTSNIDSTSGSTNILDGKTITVTGKVELVNTYSLNSIDNIPAFSIYNISNKPIIVNSQTWLKNNQTGEYDYFPVTTYTGNLPEYIKCHTTNGTHGYVTMTATNYSKGVETKEENTSFNFPAYNSLINQTKNYDAFLLRLETESGPGASTNFGVGSKIHIIVGDDDNAIYTCPDKSNYKGDNIYVVAIPITYSNKPTFAIIPFDKTIQSEAGSCMDKLNDWAKHVRHIVCDTNIRKGSFYLAQKSDTQDIKQSFDINPSGTINFSIFDYGDAKNMWNEAERLELLKEYPKINTNNLVAIDEFLKTNFDSIVLTIHQIPVYYSITDLDFTKAYFEEKAKEIEELNEKIKEQYEFYKQDNSFIKYTPGTNIYIFDDEDREPNKTLDVMSSKKINSSSPYAYFRVHWSSTGKSGDRKYYFGLYDEDLILE